MATSAVAGLGLDPYVVDTLMPDLVGHDRRLVTAAHAAPTSAPTFVVHRLWVRR